MKYIGSILITIFLGICIAGCYYDDPDILDPNRATCDTTIITYSGSVNPILTANCTGCHSGANAPAGVKMDAHASVKLVATSGKLMGSINHAAGYSPMPKNGTKLSECNIAKIRQWVAAGAPNN